MKILVTGGAGFIGSHICEALQSRGDEVDIVDDFNDYYKVAIKEANIRSVLSYGKSTLFRGDITDREFMESLPWKSYDAIIHLAARAGVRPSLEQPRLYWNTNIIGSLNLFELARQYEIKTFVFVSSSSVYGNCDNVPFREDEPVLNPVSPYAATKRSGELMAFNYHHLYDMNVSCLRYFTVYGPRQRPEMAIHYFCEKIRKGEPIPMFGDGQTARDYTFVEDIVAGTLSSLDRCKGYSIYNLGGSKTTKLADLIGMLGKALGKKAIIERLPMQPGDVKQTFADVSKAKRELEYEPQVDIEKGIVRFVDWFLKKEA